MIIPEEAAVQFATDLLASALSTVPTEEDVLAEPSNTTGASDLPDLSSPDRTTMLPPTSETGTLLETTTAPPSIPTTELVSTNMIQVISLSFIFLYTFREV